MGLLVPKLEYIKSAEPAFKHPNAHIQKALEALLALLPDLVNLAAIQKTCDCLASDIEKNRRRINALEYIMIPDTRETIKFIRMKLGENERQNIARLMKLGFKNED
jgi:V/A-type H+-transporting ATPase subunit D